MTPSADVNIYDLSDDEILNMIPPRAEAAIEAAPQAEPVEPAAPVEAQTDTTTADDATTPAASEVADESDTPAAGDPAATPVEVPGSPAAATPAADDASATPAAATDPDAAPAETPATTTAAPAEPTADDYKAFYDRLLTKPIKANGKEIQLQTPDEAEKLIQMGLNYTKKMHALQPRLRVLTMLENHGLLDETRLAHLIDVSKGNPEAIQKLLADQKFDPMAVDADKAASYTPGNHRVSDAEMAFNAALDELESSETGVTLISEVAKQWDERSRQAAYQDPSILLQINDHKISGIYGRIHTEIERLTALGQLQGVPFLQAYKAVGDMLNDRGALGGPQKQPAPAVPVATRVATPAPVVTNNDRAKAASPTRATPTAPKTSKNYLELPDDEFLKQMGGRL